MSAHVTRSAGDPGLGTTSADAAARVDALVPLGDSAGYGDVGYGPADPGAGAGPASQRRPARYTAVVSRMAGRSAAGLPATASRSASYPGAILPLRSPTAHARAARLVTEASAWALVNPRWAPK